MHKSPSFSRLALALALSLPAIAQAESIEGIKTFVLMPGWETDQGTQMAGLQITLQDGWHTYWRAPGDAGIPPLFDWSGSNNLHAVRVHWPRPEVFELSGMRTIGYKNEVVFPIEFFAKQADTPIQIEGQVAIGVCKDICLPVTLDLSAVLGTSSAAPAERAMIQTALTRRPETASGAGVGKVVCTTTPIDDGLQITAQIPVAALGRDEVVVIEPERKDIWVSQSRSTRSGATLTATADLVPPEAKPFGLDRSKVRLTVLGSDGAVDLLGCVGG